MRTIVAIAALALAGCTVSLDRSATPTTTSAPRPTEVEAPPAREASTAPSEADYQRALDYFEGYCYSDCGQVAQDSWEYHLNRSDPEDLRRAVVTMSWLSYAEVDALCDVFWDESDDDVAARFDIDRDAVLTAFYYVCDT